MKSAFPHRKAFFMFWAYGIINNNNEEEVTICGKNLKNLL